MMSLLRKGQIGGFAILGGLALTILVSAFGIQEVRIGGPLHQTEQTMNDLTADILPPPIFQVEPWLEATLIVDGHGSRSEHVARMEQLRKTFLDRRAYWNSHEFPAELETDYHAATAEADKFWQDYERSFLPAVRSGDTARIDAAHLVLGEDFAKHREAIAKLVQHSADVKTETDAEAGSALVLTVGLIGVLATVIMGMVVFGILYLRRQALMPLAETADLMTRMAAGDLEAGRRSEHRGDEIGGMTRAIEVFRESAKAQRAAEAKQKEVVESLSTALDQLAEGDLAYLIEKPLAPEYEALRSGYNQTIGKLAELMRRVSASASSVSTGAGEIRAASDDLALRNEQQAASLEETAAAMNQVTGIVKETADSAANVQRSISDAHHEATDGGEVVQRAIGAMAAIEASAQEITQIINVIDGSAFQTNLLARNAGVAAARAGAAGKGFAGVANEVRALAQRSADAAKDIKELINASTEQVAGGVKLVNETGTLLEKIVGRVGHIREAVIEIARSTENQSINLEQVNSAVSDMDRMTQQNAAMVEQSTAAARSLADVARELNQLVAQFRTGAESAAMVSFPATAQRRRAAAAPPLPVQGNLAIQAAAAPADDDWSEF